jgi:hypothetical protein
MPLERKAVTVFYAFLKMPNSIPIWFSRFRWYKKMYRKAACLIMSKY